eukprot:gene1365-1567_t
MFAKEKTTYYDDEAQMNRISIDNSQPLEVRVTTKTSPAKMIMTLVLVSAVLYYLYTQQQVGAGAGSGASSGIMSIISSKPYKAVQTPTETFDDVVGADEAKSELQDLVDFLRHPQKYADRNIVIPKGILLVGPPGTGKTLLARALAGEARTHFLTINGSEFEEMFVGVGAKRVRELFETARKNAPCIIFIDEIDSVGGNRAKRVSYHPSDALNQLLVELDGFNGREGVVVIAATNFQETLDPALVRSGRFDRSIQVQLPDCKSRKKIIELYLRNKKFSTNVNTQILAQATPGFSGADLFNLVNWAALDATKNNMSDISMETLENAKENIIMGKERHSLILTDEARKICAYHEAGHALVAIKTAGAKEVHKATIMPRGDALGLVSMLQKDDFFQTKKQYLADMDVAMGGRAAEELILGDENISQGASSDIQKATSIAKAMVLKLGMSDKVGKIYIDSEKKLSPQQRELIDSEVKSILDQSYERAATLLKKYSKEHHLLAQALIEYETLSLEEIKAIIDNKPLNSSKKNRDALVKEREEKEIKRQSEASKRPPAPIPLPRVAPTTTTSTSQPSNSTTSQPGKIIVVDGNKKGKRIFLSLDLEVKIFSHFAKDDIVYKIFYYHSAFGAFVWNETHLTGILDKLEKHPQRSKVKILLGGPQVSYAPKGTLERYYPTADYFIRGYAEDAMTRTVEEFIGSGDSLDRIDGLHMAGQEDLGKQAKLELDHAPSPFFGVIDITKQSFIRWETQRGCPFKCTFCQHRDSYESRKQFSMIDRLRKEIELICSHESAVRDIAVLDPTFNAGPHYLEVMEHIILGGYKGRLSLQCRFEMMKEEFVILCQRMVSTGVDLILEFGIQSTQKQESIAIGRLNNLARVQQWASRLHEVGVPFEISLIYGLPHQSVGSFEKSIEYCQALKPKELVAWPLMLLRGTNLETRKQEFGLVEEIVSHVD